MQKIDFIYSNDLIDYNFAINFMQNKVEGIINNQENGAIWLLEHNDIYTLGKNSIDSDIKTKINIPYIDTNRGGRITYHGPGQKIIYVMLDIKKLYDDKPNLRLFIEMLQDWIILILQQKNIISYKNIDQVGVWIKGQNVNKKIASMGIRIKRWISYHGLALNINPNMKYFTNINPCGIHNCNMTSMFLETNLNIKNNEINNIIKNSFFNIFNLNLDKEYVI